jgi:hypothetical protein
MSVKQMPHYTLPATALAEWIESQPEKWWSVDGDPYLMSILDFPCPSDELAPAIRKTGKDLVLQDNNATSTAHGEQIGVDRLDELSDVGNRRRRKALLLSWADSTIDWLLLEDEALVQK